MILTPTIDDIRDAMMEEAEDFELVHEKADPSWRHGCYMFSVWKRLSDGTFWSVNWQRSGDGEYNSLRDGDCDDRDVAQVWPVTKTVTDYVAKEPA